MNTQIKGLKADAALTESYLIVKEGSDADHVTPTTADTDAVTGVTRETARAEQAVGIDAEGRVRLRADGAITKDADVVPSENVDGYAKVGTATDGETIVAKALHAADDGDVFLAILDGNFRGET